MAEAERKVSLGAPAAFTAALSDVQRLLGGGNGRRYWRELAVLAITAGLVGVGAQPPPLGLLQPLLSDSTLRANLSQSMAPSIPALLLLGGGLLLLLPFSRAFTMAFVAGVLKGEPDRGGWRSFVGPGIAHFLWSSALTLPLYALLFAAELEVTGGAWESLLRADERSMLLVLLAAVGKFLLVLLPWVVLTLPVMVTLYELTPVEMVRGGGGPARACGAALRTARTRGAAFAGYLGVRLALQVAGTVLASIALVPCLAVSGIVGGPLLGLCWLAAGALGSTKSGPGAAAMTVGVLGWTIPLYCLVCTVLVPVSTLLFAFAARFLGGQRGKQAAVETE